ncbi:MAG: acyltransferase [Burkholderiales bacterium]|nr:acyltransferase [Burkholderiales bacterium]
MKATPLSALAVGKQNHFNLIRLLAALAVLWSHSYALTGQAEPFAYLGKNLGSMAVDVFFVTSGFLVTTSLLQRGDAIDYLIARTLRIFPALWVMLLVTVLGLGLLLTHLSVTEFFKHPQTWRYVWKTSTLLGHVEYVLPGVFEFNPYPAIVNGSLWTMVYELSLYLGLLAIWSLARLLSMLMQPALAFLLALSLTVSFFYGCQHFAFFDAPSLLRFAFLFFTGSVFYLARTLVPMSSALFAVSMGTLLGVAVFFPNYFSAAYLLCLPYCVFYLAYVPKGPLLQLNRVGDYSYGIYIYAFPVQQVVLVLFPTIAFWKFNYLVLLITLSLAALSWHSIEKPILQQRARVRDLFRWQGVAA